MPVSRITLSPCSPLHMSTTNPATRASINSISTLPRNQPCECRPRHTSFHCVVLQGYHSQAARPARHACLRDCLCPLCVHVIGLHPAPLLAEGGPPWEPHDAALAERDTWIWICQQHLLGSGTTPPWRCHTAVLPRSPVCCSQCAYAAWGGAIPACHVCCAGECLNSCTTCCSSTCNIVHLPCPGSALRYTI